jgi:hypothetical protein
MAPNSQLRDRLIDLVNQIRDSRDHGHDDPDSLSEFERLVPKTDVDNLCNSDYSDETIVDLCLGEKDAEQFCTPDELLELVRKLVSPKRGDFENEAASTLAVLKFKHNCKHPAKSDLIYYPAKYFGGNQNPTAEQIVEKALSGE